MSTLLGPKTTNCLILALQSEYFPASLIHSDSYVNVFGLWPKTRHLEALPWAFIMIYTHFLTLSQMKQWLIIIFKKFGPLMHHQQISKYIAVR